MATQSLRYDQMVQNALRGVVKEALRYAGEHGLPGAHHFYVTFRTDYPGVDIPGFLTAQYPTDMTIVLEHQFWGLEVDDEKFGVTLSFRGQSQRLTIPLLAIRAFVDPSVKFGLEFPAEGEAEKQVTQQPGSLISMPEAEPEGSAGNRNVTSGKAKHSDKPAEVVKLDAFRKK